MQAYGRTTEPQIITHQFPLEMTTPINPLKYVVVIRSEIVRHSELQTNNHSFIHLDLLGFESILGDRGGILLVSSRFFACPWVESNNME
jgi:hypothetical protein